MADEKETIKDPYQKYKDYKWSNPDIFKNGPLSDENRKCRDVLCCLFFIIFLGVCVFVAVIGFKNGDPDLILYPYDEDGKECGREDKEDYKYLYFYNSIENLKNWKIKEVINGFCVSNCPTVDLKEDEERIYLNCSATKNNPDCNVTKKNYYTSKSFINRFCIPYDYGDQEYDPYTDPDNLYTDPNTNITYIKLSVVKEINETANNTATSLINLSFFSGDRLTTWIADLYVTWPAILGSLGWSFILCLIFLLFIRLCAAVIVYLVIILVFAALIVLSIVFKLRANYYEEIKDEVYENTMTALFYVCLFLAVAYLIFILCMCNRIRLGVALIEATAKYIHHNCYIIFVPFIFFIITGLFYAYWVTLSIYLYSTGDLAEDSKVIASIKWTKKIRYAWWFHLFSLFYMNEFLEAIGQFIYASSACIWYFVHEKGLDVNYISTSLRRAFRFHLGSLAFGSLIVAIIRFIMFIIEFVKKRIDQTYGKKSDKSKIYRCLISCCQCFMECIARTIEFINKHAYIQIALKGENFCTSAWVGFGLLIRNLGRFSSLILIGTFFSIFGMLFIAAASGVIGYYVITEVSYFSEKLNSPVLPVFAMVMIGFILGMVSMSVVGMSSDALMHSFLLDEELNRGQAKAFPELQKFMSDER